MIEASPLSRPSPLGYCTVMARKKRYLTATMADGYVKTIGPTATPLTHYWASSRICTTADRSVLGSCHICEGGHEQGGADRTGGEAIRVEEL
jgi:hypothetical protein